MLQQIRLDEFDTNKIPGMKTTLSESCYEWKNSSPNDIQIKKMHGLLAEELTEFIMSNQLETNCIYTWKLALLGYNLHESWSWSWSEEHFTNTTDSILDILIRLHKSYVDDKNVAVDVEVEEGEDYTAVVDRTST